MRYPILIETEDGSRIATFPDCPGCVSQADGDEDIQVLASDALRGWLESHLAHGEAPPKPSVRVRATRGTKLGWVQVEPRLALRMSLRWARQDAGLTQAQLAARLGVSAQQIAKFENPDSNPTLDTIIKFAQALRVEFDLVFRSSDAHV